MLDLLKDLSPHEVTGYARTVPVSEEFFLTREVIKYKKVPSIKYKIKNLERRVNMALFRAYDAATPLGRREMNHSFLEGILPPIGVKLNLGELETILQALESGADIDPQVRAQIFDDVDSEVLGVHARFELAAGDLLTDGKFTLAAENGLTLEADFQMASGFKPTSAISWDDDDALILDDMQAWNKQLQRNGSGRAGNSFASQTVLDQFAKNKQFKQVVFGTDFGVGRPTLNPDQVSQALRTYGLPIPEPYDCEVRDADGNLVRTTPEAQFFMVPPANRRAQWAETQIGITAEALALSRSGNPRIEREDLPGLVTTLKEDDDPVNVTSKTGTVGMPVLYDNAAHISAIAIH